MFLHGLADRVQREIYMLDLPPRLNGLIDLALRVDSCIDRLEQHARSTCTTGSTGVRGSSTENRVGPVVHHKPMQVGRERRERGGGPVDSAFTVVALDISYTLAR